MFFDVEIRAHTFCQVSTWSRCIGFDNIFTFLQTVLSMNIGVQTHLGSALVKIHWTVQIRALLITLCVQVRIVGLLLRIVAVQCLQKNRAVFVGCTGFVKFPSVLVMYDRLSYLSNKIIGSANQLQWWTCSEQGYR